jgi:hypothetical protein
MKHSPALRFLKVACALAFIIAISASNTVLLAQTPCSCAPNPKPCFLTPAGGPWAVTVVLAPDANRCNDSLCSPHINDQGHLCDTCIDVTITNNCNFAIDFVTIASNGNNNADCHAVCSPTGDFTPEPTPDPTLCSWHTPSKLFAANPLGIAPGASAKFRICHASPGFQYTITPHFTGGNCNATAAVICF